MSSGKRHQTCVSVIHWLLLHCGQTSTWMTVCLALPDITGALSLQQELCKVLNDVGLVLRKWHSNSLELVQHIPEELRDTSPKSISPEPMYCIKALGVHWDTEYDAFYVSIPNIDGTHPTKHSITSAAACLFDVMGWMSLVTLYVKMMLQMLWQHYLDWDGHIPNGDPASLGGLCITLSKYPIATRYTDYNPQRLHISD